MGSPVSNLFLAHSEGLPDAPSIAAFSAGVTLILIVSLRAMPCFMGGLPGPAGFFMF